MTPSWRARWFPNGEWIVLLALAAEVLVFGAIAQNFLTIGNLFEIVRLSVELGLLAVALTPILVTGGIDLSVGSMMGLAAIVLGAAHRDRGLPLPVAAMLAMLTGCAGGALNAVLIARLNIPPLIVTLGTFSLFRGIAEGLTQAAVNYTGFPARFLALGQGYLGGVVPAQLPLFLLVVAAYAVLLHRSVAGRAWYAIGFGAAGARYAGLPVARRIALAYLLSGFVASVAAIVYVAHMGQAKSDAGTGYELDAITAVVLGGTSVFGGRGTIWGTLIGLFALSVLRNGLHLAALPSELTGVVTGTLLVATIAIDRVRGRARARRAVYSAGTEEERGAEAGASGPAGSAAANVDRAADVIRPGLVDQAGTIDHAEDIPVRNSQVAVLCGAILFGSMLVAATNVWLVRSLASSGAAGMASAGPGDRAGGGAAGSAGTGAVAPGELPAASPRVNGRRPVIAVMPKAKGDPYFVSCRAGAEEAAKELGVDLIWDGPTSLDAAKQNELVENWITRKVDVIAVAVENRGGISSVLRKARERGIRVVTWDSDADPDARDYFVNQATSEGIGNTLTDEAARLLGGRGEFAVITGALSAANQNEWIAFIRKRLAEKYPNLTLATIRPSDDDRDKAFAETQTILRVFPAVKLVMAISAPAVPGSAEAVRQANRRDVNVIGLSLPNINKPYVHDGWVQTVVLWNTRDLGYLTVLAGSLLTQNGIPPGTSSISAGRLGKIQIRGTEVVLGEPTKFTKGNIDRFDF